MPPRKKQVKSVHFEQIDQIPVQKVKVTSRQSIEKQSDATSINFVDMLNRFNARVQHPQIQPHFEISQFVTPIPKPQRDEGSDENIELPSKQKARKSPSVTNQLQQLKQKYPTFQDMREELFEDVKFTGACTERMVQIEEFEAYNHQLVEQNFQLIYELFKSKFAVGLVGSYGFGLFFAQFEKILHENQSFEAKNCAKSQTDDSDQDFAETELVFARPLRQIDLKKQIEGLFDDLKQRKDSGEVQMFRELYLLIDDNIMLKSGEYVKYLLENGANIFVSATQTTQLDNLHNFPIINLFIETLSFEYEPQRVERVFSRFYRNQVQTKFELFKGIIQHQLSNLKFQFYLAAFLEILSDKLPLLNSTAQAQDFVKKEELNQKLSHNMKDALSGKRYVEGVRKLLLVKGQQDTIMQSAYRAQTAKGSVVVLDITGEGYGLFEVEKQELLLLLEVCHSVLLVQK